MAHALRLSSSDRRKVLQHLLDFGGEWTFVAESDVLAVLLRAMGLEVEDQRCGVTAFDPTQKGTAAQFGFNLFNRFDLRLSAGGDKRRVVLRPTPVGRAVDVRLLASRPDDTSLAIGADERRLFRLSQAVAVTVRHL